MRPSCKKPSGWRSRMPASHGSRPEYDVSMCPLNMSDFPLPSPSQRPTTLGRPSSTSCHCTWRPMSASSSRTRSPIASSCPVGLEMETSSTARRARRSASTSTEMRQHLLAEELDLLVPAISPELEHHVRAPGAAVLLDRSDAVVGRPGDRLALVEDLVRHLPFSGEAPALLHRLGDRTDLFLRQPGKVEQRVRRALDVLHLVGEVHACDLACAVAADVTVALVDRRDDGTPDVNVRRDVLTRVPDERGSRDRRRETAVRDLACERLHLRRSRGDVDRRDLARRLGGVLQTRHGRTESLALVVEGRTGKNTAHDVDG